MFYYEEHLEDASKTAMEITMILRMRICAIPFPANVKLQ